MMAPMGETYKGNIEVSVVLHNKLCTLLVFIIQYYVLKTYKPTQVEALG